MLGKRHVRKSFGGGFYQAAAHAFGFDTGNLILTPTTTATKTQHKVSRRFNHTSSGCEEERRGAEGVVRVHHFFFCYAAGTGLRRSSWRFALRRLAEPERVRVLKGQVALTTAASLLSSSSSCSQLFVFALDAQQEIICVDFGRSCQGNPRLLLFLRGVFVETGARRARFLGRVFETIGQCVVRTHSCTDQVRVDSLAEV